MPTKTVKINNTHHRQLKIKGAEQGVSLQQYLAFILELAFTEEPDLKQAREAYFSAVAPRLPDVMRKVESASEEGIPPRGGIGGRG
jgi:hypothetical protein